MGKYINKTSKGILSAVGKVEELISDGAKKINTPESWEEGLVCVIENFHFDAALYIDSVEELNYIVGMNDGRKKTYLKYEKAKDFAR